MYKRVFKLTNKYIILATPLILFSFLSNIYLMFSAKGTILNVLFSMILFIIMTGAFFAGWFKMITSIVQFPEEESNTQLAKKFTEGVGEYIIPSLIAIINILLFTSLLLFISHFAGMKFIGNPNISVEALSQSMKNPELLKTFIETLSQEQIIKINYWNLLLLGTLCINCFLLIFYYPAIFFKSKNPFKAFYINLKNIFSTKILKTIGLYIIILSSWFVISLLTTLLTHNVILSFIMVLINFYYLIYISICIFDFYYHEFVLPDIKPSIDIKI